MSFKEDEITTREISRHLIAYCEFLYSEASRMHALNSALGNHDAFPNAHEIQSKADEVSDLANRLYDMKTTIKGD